MQEDKKHDDRPEYEDVVVMQFRTCYYDVPYQTLVKTGMNPALLTTRKIKIEDFYWGAKKLSFCFRDAMTMGFMFFQKRPEYQENVLSEKVENIITLAKSLGMRKTAWTDTNQNMYFEDFLIWYDTLPTEIEYVRGEIFSKFGHINGPLSVNDVHDSVKCNKETLRQVFQQLVQEGQLIADNVSDADSKKFLFVERQHF